jgi:excisionase family DNA binding protein
VVRLPELLTTQQAADLLRVSRPTLVRLLDDGVIPSERISAHRRVARAAVMEYLDGRSARAKAGLDALAEAGGPDPPRRTGFDALRDVAVLDACVLVPIRLCGILPALAEAGLSEPRWSERILLETEGALVAMLGQSPAKAAKRIAAMRAAFPEASVYGFEPLEPALTCHPKGRHVLAAAISAGAGAIVTGNLKDFPNYALTPHAVEAVHPDRFLCRLLAADPGGCREAVEAEAATRRHPPETPAALLAGATRVAPTFVNLMSRALVQPEPPSPRALPS